MEVAWCDKIKIVQDATAFWSTDGWTSLFIHGILALLIFVAIWKFNFSKIFYVFGVLFISIGTWNFNAHNDTRLNAVKNFNGETKYEVIGTVLKIQVRGQRVKRHGFIGYYYSYGKFEVLDVEDAPNNFQLKSIRFNIDGQQVSIATDRLAYTPGKKCKWPSCQLKVGDQVRVSKWRGHTHSTSNYPLRIERCDDPI